MNFMKNVKNLILFAIFIFTFILGMAIASQFIFVSDIFRGVFSGIKHGINPPQVSKDYILNNETFSNKVETNSFIINVENIEEVSIKHDREKTLKKNQFVNSGLYAKKNENKTEIIYFTRNGYVVKNGELSSFILPKTYSPHNSKGGIRGVFFNNNIPYALMASKKIACDYAAIINLKTSKEIFSTECLPDTSKINYDGVGGASIHLPNKILLTIGTPSNNSEFIRSLAQNKDSFFGKIIEIDKKNLSDFENNKIEKIDIEIYSSGHRNPQGMARIDNRIYSSEHGPKGGDEINFIIKNKNYGWPKSSYGTKYFIEPSADYNKGEQLTKYYENSHTKYGFEEPLLQFTPSIGISSLTNCPKKIN